MQLHTQMMSVSTHQPGLHSITDRVASVVAEAALDQGQCVVFVRHTSASLLIQENADPAVCRDLQRFAEGLAPEDDPYEHDDEGPDDMPAHIRSAVTQTSLVIPLIDGRLALGTWQGIFLWEHRRAPHTRQIVVQVWGPDPA